MGRFGIRLAVVGLVSVIVAGVGGGSAGAAVPPGQFPGGDGKGVQADYLALGDSVAFGFRPSPPTPLSDYLNAANFVGYPNDVASAEREVLTNASCPGETSGSMISPTAVSNGCENGYRAFFPLHVAYTVTQLQFAVAFLRSHPHTRLVTIDIGANDLFLCQKVTTDHCTGADFQATLAQISANLAIIYSTLRDQAHYHHALVALTYYSLDYGDPVQVAGTEALDQAIAQPTLAARGIVADGFAAFQGPSNGGTPCAAGLVIALGGGNCDVHPTPTGHALLAKAIVAALVQG
jgi:lysophospholipase L1-like esterase